MNAPALQQVGFFRLSKVDEEKRLVYGRAVQEVPDRVGEIFDYETSKPNFQKWSASQFDASLGKSNGNIRAMHKDIAAGIVVPGGITFHDQDKAIDICVKIGDDASWAAVLDGRYTGFSIGGKYAKKWEDTEMKKTRYTADPSEISLVDRPCIPTSKFFEIQKADGVVVQKEFAPAKAAEAEEKKDDVSKSDVAHAAAVIPAAAAEDEYDIQATPEEVNKFCKLLATGDVKFQDVLGALEKGFPFKAKEGDDAKGKKDDAKEEASESTAETAAEDKKAEAAMTPEEKAASKKKADDEAAAAAAKASEKADAIAGLAKAAFDLANVAADLAKAGARNSKSDQEALQKAHDALNAAGAMCNKNFVFSDSEPGAVAAEAGTVNTGSNAVPAVAAAPNDKAEPAGDLKKIETERDALKKLVDDQTAALAKLTADVAMLKAQPMPSTVRLRAVGKGEDLTDPNEKIEKIAPVKDAHGEEHSTATLIKGIHKTGGEQLYKF